MLSRYGRVHKQRLDACVVTLVSIGKRQKRHVTPAALITKFGCSYWNSLNHGPRPTTASVLKNFSVVKISSYTVFRFVRILAEILAIFQQRIRTKKNCQMSMSFTTACLLTIHDYVCNFFARSPDADTLTFFCGRATMVFRRR